MPWFSDSAGAIEECAGQRRDDGRTIRDAVMAREVQIDIFEICDAGYDI